MVSGLKVSPGPANYTIAPKTFNDPRFHMGVKLKGEFNKVETSPAPDRYNPDYLAITKKGP